MKKTIGIIGGMGPAAGCDLNKKIIDLTSTSSDQEHIHVILDNNTNICDRTKYILNYMKKKNEFNDINNKESKLIKDILSNYTIKEEIESPYEEIKKSAILLESAGCDAIAMSCVTAHYFEKEIRKIINIPFISIPEVVSHNLHSNNKNTAALLVTNGTLCGKIFEPHLQKYNIKPIYPNFEQQKFIMDLIYKYVKSGKTNELINIKTNVIELINSFIEQGTEAFILGCTELPIVFDYLSLNYNNQIDVTNKLAESIVNFCTNK